MACAHCGKDKILARKLCSACYWRHRRTGSIDRTNVSNVGPCCVDGCGKKSFAKNMCAHHYEKAQHPLTATWKLLRSRHPGQFPEAWSAFAAFHQDVGERPSPRHQLRRKNPRLPFSADNVEWLEPVGVQRGSRSTEEHRIYTREWNLQRRFKLTGEEFKRLLAEQDGACAICRGRETHTYKSGRVKELSVDHDHVTGAIRGLLCFNCNQGLGRFQDDPDRLRAAAAYLEKFSRPRLVCEAAE